MPETGDLREAQVAFVCTNIGRGHPFYLDGVISAFNRDYPQIRYLKSDIFRLSRNTSRLAWTAVRQLYQIGARGGIISDQYNRLRNGLASEKELGLASTLLGKDVRLYLAEYKGPVVVSHPLLALILKDQNAIIYQHGELAAPNEALIDGCFRIFVPTAQTAKAFSDGHIRSENIIVTGHCIEHDLIELAIPAYNARLKRIKYAKSLTVGLFSSGANPREHIRKLLLVVQSLISSGHKVVVFAGLAEKCADQFTRFLQSAAGQMATGNSLDDRVLILHAANRQEFDAQVVKIFLRLDLFVAPAHERTNWAVGLGLPQFILCPHLGTYAPLNASIAITRGVAAEIPNDNVAGNFATFLTDYRNTGRIEQMAANGFGHSDLDGFSHCAREISTLISSWRA